MRKSDVELYDGLPSVNVKVHGYWDWQRHAADVAAEYGDTGFTAEWCAEHVTADMEQSYFESACEAGWEMAQTDADEVLGIDVTVESRGRSGGHLVVRGLPDVDDWDAIALSRWARYARYARSTADAVPEDMATLVCINAYAAWRDRQDAREALHAAAELPVLLTV